MTHSVVVGGAGFIGSWIVEEILKDPSSRITIIDNLISSEKWNISTDPRVTFIEESAAKMNTFEKIGLPVDFIYQLACFHGNQSSIDRPFDDLENGLKTTLTTLEWARKYSPESRIVYSSAGCALAAKTWEIPEATEEIEQTSLYQDSPYSISKISGEMYCNFYSKNYGLNIVRMRFQNVYGPREILGAGEWRGNDSTVWRNVVPTLIYKAMKNIDLNIFGKEASRDFTYVEDVARLVVRTASIGQASNAYNIATGEETFIVELARQIIEITDSNSRINIFEKRPWDNSGRRLGNNNKLKYQFSLVPQVTINEGLKKTIEWFNLNFDRIEDTILKHRSAT